MYIIKGYSINGVVEIFNGTYSESEAIFITERYKFMLGDKWDIWYE